MASLLITHLQPRVSEIVSRVPADDPISHLPRDQCLPFWDEHAPMPNDGEVFLLSLTVVLWCVVLCFVLCCVVCCVVLCVVLCCVVFCVVLCCVVFCVVLCCVVLCYVVLYCDGSCFVVLSFLIPTNAQAVKLQGTHTAVSTSASS